MCRGEVVQRCKQCKSTQYCSKTCQQSHWDEHKVICKSIKQLQDEANNKCKEACDFSASIAPECKKKLMNLIGDKCTIACVINGRECDALWDTGAQVSLISKRWLDRHMGGEYQIEDLSEVIGRDIKVKGAVGAEIPYAGYVVLNCKIAESDISIPFLVSEDRMDEPIVGYNVIAHLVTESKEISQHQLKTTFPTLNVNTVNAVVKTLRADDLHKISKVKLHKFDSIIKAGASISLPCRISQVILDRQSPVLLEPEHEELLPYGIDIQTQLLSLKKGHNRRLFITVTNNSLHDVRIPGRTKLGDLFVISSITPAEVKLKEDEVTVPETKSTSTDLEPQEHGACVSSALVSGNQDEQESADMGELDAQYKLQLAKIKLPAELNVTQQQEVRQMLWDEREAFAESEEVIGSAEDLQMDLTTTDEIPVQKRYNSIPRPLMTEVKYHIEDMLNRGWITRSNSAWSSPVVIVRKSTGDIRLCCDFRQLNQKTIPDKHPLPRVQETLDNLAGSKWFSVVDLTRAYYQGYISPESRHKTAFVTPWGFYQWVRIPFGLMNAPASFQRYMENVISDLRGKCAIPYLDDVIVHSANFNEHVQHIRNVLQRLRKHGLKLKASKCDLFRTEVKFLGRIVTEHGYRMDEKNISAVDALRDVKPTDASEVRQILGLLGYHRRHIQSFSQIAKPMSDLLIKTDKEQSSKSSKKTPIEWTDQCQHALETLINEITKAPLLEYPDFSKEFVLHTDASTKGLGAILYQRSKGEDLKAIGYASRTLHKSEANYHPTKLEFLALKWSVTEAFREYLAYANDFLILTDNNPLVYVMEATKLNAFGERWVSELAEYNFTIRYRPGSTNKDADCLSRLPLDISSLEEKCTQEIVPDAFQAIMTGMFVQSKDEETWRAQINYQEIVIGGLSLKEDDNILDVASAQEADEDISKIIAWKKSGVTPTRDKADSKELSKLKQEFHNLHLKDGMLIRKLTSIEQVVMPKSLRSVVYKQLHKDMGHLGAERVGELARNRVYWPWMQKDITDFIQNKCTCLKQRKPQHHNKAPLHSITTNAPLELVTIDFLHLEKGSGGNEYILVIVDHFTKFVQAYPTRNKFTKTVAKHLYNDFILRFGIPTKLLSDQGGEFESKVIHELSELAGVKKLRTTPYHPQTNGLCERMNRTLLHMLRTLPETMKTQWPSMVNKMTHAYNCTKHSSTGFTPFRLMFGREATLPIDLILGLTNHEEDRGSYSKLAKKWDEQMRQAYTIVRENMKGRQNQNETQCNRRPLLMPLAVGDRVLVKNTETGGPGKLRSYWEQDVYVVTAKKGDLEVVFEVRKENVPKARRRVVHRNMLLPVEDQFGADTDNDPKTTTTDKARVTSTASSHTNVKSTRKRITRSTIQDAQHSDSDATDDSSDSEMEMTPVQLQSWKQSALNRQQQSINDVCTEVATEPLEVGEKTYCDLFDEADQETFHGFEQSDSSVNNPVGGTETDVTTVNEAVNVEMFAEDDQDAFHGFSVTEPIGTSSPKPEVEPTEVGEKTYEDMFAEDEQRTFDGFGEFGDTEQDIETDGVVAEASETVVTEDAVAHTDNGTGSSSRIHTNDVSVRVPESGQDPTGRSNDLQLSSSFSLEQVPSQISSEFDLSQSEPSNRPSPAKTVCERWKMRRNDERCRNPSEDTATELSRRCNRKDLFDPSSVSAVGIQSTSVATQTSDWNDLSEWLQKAECK